MWSESTPAERRAAREQSVEDQVLHARHLWEHGQLTRAEFDNTERILREQLRAANERDHD